MVALIKTLQVILALSILIIAHEFGHFTFAKLFGIRVDKFYLFFDVGGRSLFKFRIGDTVYGMGWLPLGGYCKICGMIDESMDIEGLKSDPQPWEFRSKPAWQRLLVLFGGVLFNFIFAILLFSGMLAKNGQAYVPNSGNAIYVNDLSYEMGFRTGDQIVSFDDYVPENFWNLQSDLGRRLVHKATVLRNGDTLEIYLDRAMIGDVMNTPGMFDLALPFVVDSVMSSSPNVLAGIEKGDRVIAFDSLAVDYIQDSRAILSDRRGKNVTATLVRGKDTLSLPLQVDTSGRIGVYMQSPEYRTREYSLLASFPAGCAFTWEMIRDYVRDLRLIATPSTQAYKSVGSFIAVGQIFPSAWDWEQFFYILGVLSIMLGVMNLIPIPGLDGGHILFTLVEIVSGRKPSDKFMLAAQMIGMIFLIALMMMAFGNDIGRLMK